MSAPSTSRVAKAATRYRPGKAPLGAGERYSSDEDGSAVETEEQEDARGTAKPVEPLGRGYAPIQSTSAKQASAEIDSSEYETDTDEETNDVLRPTPVFRPPLREPERRDALSSDDQEEESSDGDESDSSGDTPLPIQKPIFKSKKERGTLAAPFDSAETTGEVHAAERKKNDSHALAAARIKQELREKEDREAKPDLDDTDGLDPEAEFSAWREREQVRLQRERQAEKSKELERADRQRRQAMSEEQRLAEDLAYARKTRDEKRKGEQGFLQKYHHKGSFFQDSDLLKTRDFTAMTESAVDKSQLPKMMQVRDYGKKGRSKWTHLANEDTSRPAKR